MQKPEEETAIATEDVPPKKQRRGFAAMDPAKVAAIASKGGKAAHALGTAHQFTPEEAKAAGKKGGTAPHVRRGRGPKKESGDA
jgi:general stress protein YciG